MYNKVLLYILEYYLLCELGFTDTAAIRKKLNNRWGNISEFLSIQKKSKKCLVKNRKKTMKKINIEEK